MVRNLEPLMKFLTLLSLILATLTVTSTAQARSTRCSIQTYNGNYLTAVGGGGRLTDVIHSDATRVAGWEIFTLVSAGAPMQYGLQTIDGHFVTAVGGGGRITDVLHTDGTHLKAWEKFTLRSLGHGWYAIQTVNGRYLTAVGGGGRTYDVIHSDATQVRAWEKFRIKCGL